MSDKALLEAYTQYADGIFGAFLEKANLQNNQALQKLKDQYCRQGDILTPMYVIACATTLQDNPDLDRRQFTTMVMGKFNQ